LSRSFLLDVVEREGDVACDFLEQRHLLAVEAAAVERMQGEHPARLAADDEREHRERAHAVPEKFRPERHVRRCGDVGHDHRPGGQHRARGGAGAFRFRTERQAIARLFEKVAHRAGRGGGLDPRALAVGEPDPGQGVAAGVERDAAGLLQQRLAVAGAHDEGVDPAQHRLDPGKLRHPLLGAVGRAREEPKEDKDQDHADDGVDADAERGVVPAQVLAVQPQQRERGERDEDGEREAPREAGALRAGREFPHPAAPGARREQSKGQGKHGKRAVDRHGRKGAHAVQGLHVEQVAHEGGEPKRPEDRGEGLTRARRGFPLEREECQRRAGKNEPGGSAGRHAAKVGRLDRPGGFPEEELVDARVPAEQVLRERDRAHKRHEPGERERAVARCGRWARVDEKQRRPRECEAGGGIRLHRRVAGQDAREPRQIEHPARQRQQADRDARGAREARSGREPALNRRRGGGHGSRSPAGRHMTSSCRVNFPGAFSMIQERLTK